MKEQGLDIDCNNDAIRQEEITSIPPEKIDISEQRDEQVKKPAILLHSCCGPCSTAVVERLVKDYEVTVFFYNPNITDRDEYQKRKDTQEIFIEKYNMNPDRPALLHFKEGTYNPNRFYTAVTGLENECEGGRRCEVCYRLRLEATVDLAMILGFDYFSTTLSVSPHKNYELISKIANELSMRSNMPFLADDFKKNNGYMNSVELSNKYGLYRQTYCGCEFSK